MNETARYHGGERALTGGLAAGIAGLVLTGVGAIFDPQRAMLSYLVAFLFWLGIPLGALALNMANYAAGARWHIAIRRAIETVQAPLPLFVLLFLPILLFGKHLYIWVDPPSALPAEVLEKIHHKHGYLNLGSFALRAAVYFAIWIVISELLYRWSVAQDESGAAIFTSRARRWGAGGLPFLAFSLTFAAFDWLMSLDPTFFSTIFGLYYFAGSFVAALGAMIIFLHVAQREASPFASLARVDHFHNLGKLLLAFVAFWAYMAFSQYMLIWVANLPEEIPYFLVRTHGVWEPVFVALAFGHFVVPFFLLLSRDLKRTPWLLSLVAAWMLFIHLVDLCWLALPAAEHPALGTHAQPAGLNLHWTLLTSFVGIGALVVAFAVFRARGRYPVPVRDPFLRDSLEYVQP